MSNNNTKPEIKISAAMLTDVGMVREHNEDSALIDKAMRFFVVADGMGGHAAGEIASAMAVEGIQKALDEADTELQSYSKEPSEEGRQKIAQILEEAVRESHQSVYQRGIEEPEKEGMGTTLDVLLLCGQEAFIAHVGDSRIYLIRNGTASQITTDHTVAEVLVIEGKLSAEEALVSPLRTILVNALGVSAEIGVEMAHLTLHQGDRLLLCSDGLHDYFQQAQELHDEVMNNGPDAALERLIEAAKKRGGHDNITAIIVQVVKAPAVEHPEETPIAIARGTSDGIPHAIGKDDTLPVHSSSKASPDLAQQSADEEHNLPRDPRKATIPIKIVPADSPTITGENSRQDFPGETTIELPPDSDD